MALVQSNFKANISYSATPSAIYDAIATVNLTSLSVANTYGAGISISVFISPDAGPSPTTKYHIVKDMYLPANTGYVFLGGDQKITLVSTDYLYVILGATGQTADVFGSTATL